MAGRPRNPQKPKEIQITLPEALLMELNLLFFDPAKGRPKYGARSKLIENLLREYLGKLKKGEAK